MEAQAATLVELARLRPAEWNANRVRPATLAKIRRSLERYGVVENLVARPHPGERGALEVLSGNHRLGLLRELGYESAPVVVVELDDAQARLLAQTLNRTRGEDDPDAYARLVEDVLRKVSVEEAAGVLPESEGTLERVLAGMRAPAADPDDVPEPPKKPKSRPGEVYELGPHRLMCGDAFTDLAMLYGRGEVGCVLTDPPYGIGLDTDYTSMGTGPAKSVLKGVSGRRYRPVIGDDSPFDPAPLVAFFALVREQFWFGADYYRRSLSATDTDGAYLVWDKRNEASDGGFGSGFELIWSRQPHKRDLLRHYFFGAFGRDGANRLHPTQKPVPLLAEILGRWTKHGDVIADPFAGSGSTLIAAEQTGRVCFAMEIDPAYCDVIRERYAGFVRARR